MYPYVSKSTAIPVFAAMVMWEPTVSADPEQAAAFFSLCGLRLPEMQMNIFLHTALI